jgi:phospholipase D-like protein
MAGKTTYWESVVTMWPILLSANVGVTGRQLLLLAPLVLIGFVLIITALIDLYRRETVRGSKLFWAIVIIFIGTIGPIAYFIFGRKDL